MTTANGKDRSHESIINDTLARFLREPCGLSAVAETLHDGRRPDIIVRLSAGPMVLETELEPALTVEADALSRLGMEIDGQRVQNVFAVTVPGRLRSTSQLHLYACPAFRVCTRAKEIGRSLAIGPHDAVLRRHRARMSSSAVKEAYRLRKQLVEPVFGIIKEQQGARKFLLRSLTNVAAEWTMLATAFNLRPLCRVWSSPAPSAIRFTVQSIACLVN